MSATVQPSLMTKIKDSIEIPILTKCCFCFPLRRGLMAFAYINLMLAITATCFLSLYISIIRNSSEADKAELASELVRVVVDIVGLLLELLLTVAFIVALHMKHILLMKVYLYFEISYSIIGFFYSVAFLTQETAGELFLILFQLTLQVYLVILIWGSITKMERDGDTVKYTRDNNTV